MAKKEQKPDTPVPENPIIQAFKGLQEGQKQMLANMQQLGLNDQKLSERIDAMEKNPPKKNILEQVTEIANLLDKFGVGEMIKGAFAGEKDDVISDKQIAPEGLKEYVQFTKDMQKIMLDDRREVLRGMRLEHDEKAKRINADF